MTAIPVFFFKAVHGVRMYIDVQMELIDYANIGNFKRKFARWRSELKFKSVLYYVGGWLYKAKYIVYEFVLNFLTFTD